MNRSSVLTSVRRLRSLMAMQQGQEQSDEQLLSAFIDRHDEIAFAGLVRRHGPMVLGVCRRFLGHEQDAEDAFQATFLVLAQRAGSLRDKSALASFLHRIAYHVASKARRAAGRRRKYEGQAPARPSTDPADELLWRDVRAQLDEEIAHLPEKYRNVFVLCCLEELSQAEAGRRLGLKEGTVNNRLAQARKRLAERLARRGLDLTAVLLTITLVSQPASALPAGLMATTIQAALATAAGEGLGGVVSASVAELVHVAIAAMIASKTKIAAVVVIFATLLSGAGVYFVARPPLHQERPLPEQRTGKKTAEASHSAKHESTNTEEIRGRVVDPDGKPVRGAKLVFTYGVREKIPHKIWAVSAADGRFAFTMPRKETDKGAPDESRKDTYVLAVADGYGFAAAKLDKAVGTDLTLRLVKDDVPIRGRIIDLQGKPVAGVRVQIADKSLRLCKKGDLTEWVAVLKASKENHANVSWWNYCAVLYSPAFDLLFPPVTTGTDGRFEMKGIGRERMVHLRVEGPTIATQEIPVMTRKCEKIELPKDREFPKRATETYYGADFELLTAPSRPVVGVVRDKDTGKPLAGVMIETDGSGRSGFLQTTTDEDGRYRLEGLPKGDSNWIAARADDWLVLPGEEKTNRVAYVASVKKVENPLGLGSVTIDFALKRGVWVEGRVTEKNTGKPLDANVNYFCFSDNPNAKEIASIGGRGYNNRFSRKDGVFRIPVLPGHGLIAVRAYQDHYVMAVGAEKIKGPRDRNQPYMFITAPYICFATNFHTLVEIDPKAGEESITCNVVLDPGRSLKGKVLDPAGKPLAGARISGLKDMGYWLDNVGTDFTVESLKLNKPRLLQFVHEGQKLSGYLVLNGDEKDAFGEKLKPWSTLTGRLLTSLGTPLTSVRVNCRAEVKHKGQVLHSAANVIRPDKEGRFRIEGLIAGLEYEVTVSRSNVQQNISGGNPKNLTMKPSETKDLGDLTVKPAE